MLVSELDRPTFDVILKDYFPNVRTSRQEHHGSWHEIINIGLFQIRVKVFTAADRKMTPGDVIVDVNGVRESVDSSNALLKRMTGNGINGLHECLAALRKDLLGLAAGILLMSGDAAPDLPPDPVANEADSASEFLASILD